MNIVEIIPNKKLPRKMDYFDYTVPCELIGKLEIGQTVWIPFKQSKLVGVVNGFKDKSEFKSIKDIIGTESRIKSLFDYQFKLLKWFADYYYYSFGSTLELMLPNLPKREIKIKPEKQSETTIEKKLTSSKQIKKITEQLCCSDVENKYLLFSADTNLKYDFYLNLCRNALENNEQILILFPQINRVNEFCEYLTKEIKQRSLILTSKSYTAKSRYYLAWQAIRNKEKLIVLGTRSAIFSPLNNPKVIVVDDAHSEDYKQWDQNPRYDVVKVAQKVQEFTNCKIVLSSSCPRIEHAYNAKQQNYKFINLRENVTKSQIKIINLKNEKQKLSFYLTEKLIDQLQKILAKDKKALLIVNRKGEYSSFVCHDCGFEVLCPSCNLPMVINNQELICYKCNKNQPILLACPKCQGINLQKLGIGVRQVQNELKKFLNVEIIDLADENANHQTARIKLSTNFNIKTKDLKDVDFLGFVYVDSLSYLADFNSNFKLYSLCQTLINQAKSMNKNCEVMAQTFFPDSLAFESLNLGYQYFYKNEINQRQTFGYPPFASLFKLFFQHHDLIVCQKQGNDLFNQIKKDIIKIGGKTIGPYMHYNQKVRHRYRCQIAVFLPIMSLSDENKLFQQIPEYWTIDKNPLDLL